MVCTNKNCCAGVIPPLILKEAESYFAELNVPFTFFQGNIEGWRIRSKLAVRGSSSKPMIGLFKEGTHEIVDMPDCKMHHPKINEGIILLKQWISQCEIHPYEESKGVGDLRYVQFVVERGSGSIQLALVFNSEEIDLVLSKKLEKLWMMGAGIWHSIWFNGNHKKTNTIFGPVWKLIYGSEWLWETVGEKKVCFKPATFGQANLEAFETLLRSLKRHISPGSIITEFYAGIGVIGICLLDISKKVICSEINYYSKDCFDNTLNGFSDEERSKISYKVGSASSHSDLVNQSEIVIVDPPRKGVDKKLLEEISEAPYLKELVYISCGWDSFKRDCGRLLENKWKLHVVEGYLFFPGSEHLETLAIFKRA